MTDEQSATPTGAAESTRRSSGRGVRVFLRDVLVIFVAALVISFLIKTFLIRSFYIPSESMEMTLLVNDRIIVNQLEPSLMPVSHGDIVVFRDPGNWLPAQIETPQNPLVAAVDAVLAFVGLSAPDSNDHLIKRVIGLPGDVVKCCDDFGRITVNGVPIEEPYILLPEGVTKATKDDWEVTVPADSLWVMGDNRYNSGDSAYHRDDPNGGFVPYDHLVGRAVLVSWPINRWTLLDNYPDVFRGVEDGAQTSPNTDATPEPAAPATTGG
jgi:signal peptidase I